MSQDLISKFEKLSDREVTIALCAKVDNLCREVSMDRELVKRRIDNHSVERDHEKIQDKEDKKVINFKLDAIIETQDKINKNHDDRISELEREKTFWVKLGTPILYICGSGSSGFLTWWLTKKLYGS